MRFKNKIVVVTGGGTGMGRAHCLQFAKEGAKVVVVDINPTSLNAVVEEIGSENAIGVHCDVSDETSVISLFQTVESHFDKVDFLINNAAMLLNVPIPFKPFWELDYEEWNKVFAVNAGGVFLCCKHVKPLMEKVSDGRIINISSDAIYKGYESQLAYFASKGAVAVMTRNLARELGPFNIKVNAVAPGYTLSESTVASDKMQAVEPLILKSQCISLKQQPEDVSGTVLFLCSPESRSITGQSFVVNCGAIMP
jgi:3-oxoacyl-[acyl-carrier protein] reductase